MANASIESRGAIYTQEGVVEFILDLAGYTSDKSLHKQCLLEPAFGEGDFLLPAVDRLFKAWVRDTGNSGNIIKDLSPCIRAVELHSATFIRTQQAVIDRLIQYGISASVASRLAAAWLVQGDFLLTELSYNFDTIVGNPPYVRQERIADALMKIYRERFSTLYDRADLYIPFIERSLHLLKPGGNLAFICADRWMKNRYGSKLRQMIADSFHLKVYVDMVDTPAFHSDVLAYPAITVIAHQPAGMTRVVHRPELTKRNLAALAETLAAPNLPARRAPIREIHSVLNGAEPWIFESADHLDVVRRLEHTFPTLEEAGCKVGIGVATGADKVFIAPMDELNVEPDRKLPLVMTRDIMTGKICWRGLGVINPFAADGGLVDLAHYPRLKRFLEKHKSEIIRRHCAKKAPANWYRTIDRIYPELATRPKLLIPDIKGEAHIVYEPGELYPHHNLYYITSDKWDLQALQAVLRSGIAHLFVSTYSTKMHGGYLRFQAQYLRRIRIPYWSQISPDVKKEIIRSAKHGDQRTCNGIVSTLYGLTRKEIEVIQGKDN
ncbi:MAG: Eco57I restriction-modification methylase domain-containing protein [Nitrospirae bacterium]|nr:Eco57I restriction-modification methylase domain-containing protein [Candidatus Manganitrophaceae bacterium]